MNSTLLGRRRSSGHASKFSHSGKLRLHFCRFALVGFCLVVLGLLIGLPGGFAQTGSPGPNALQRLVALHLPHLDGAAQVYYSVGLESKAILDQKEITACAHWYSRQLSVSVPITIAVLSKTDWEKVGDLIPYPMAQARPDEDGSVIFMPDSFDSFPGQNGRAHLDKKLDFISFHETGHLFQSTLKLESPDLFMQEFYATMLASAYALVERPDVVSATLDEVAAPRPRYTSFEDMDLVYVGVGFDNYDWLQVETARLAVFFVKGQSLPILINKVHAAFPPGQVLTNSAVITKLDAIRPGFRALAGDLAGPTTLPLLQQGNCAAAPAKKDAVTFFGVRNATAHDIAVVDDGLPALLKPGYTPERGKVGAQMKLPSGTCITYPENPGYIALK
jgi:hypothetical protein